MIRSAVEIHEETRTMFSLSACVIFLPSCEVNSTLSRTVASLVPLVGFYLLKNLEHVETPICRNSSKVNVQFLFMRIAMRSRIFTVRRVTGRCSISFDDLYFYPALKNVRQYGCCTASAEQKVDIHTWHIDISYFKCNVSKPPLTQVVWHNEYVGNR
jgi:hypothetical protein